MARARRFRLKHLPNKTRTVSASWEPWDRTADRARPVSDCRRARAVASRWRPWADASLGSASPPSSSSTCQRDARPSRDAGAWPAGSCRGASGRPPKHPHAPAGDASLHAGGTASLEPTVARRICPIAPQLLAVLLIRVMVLQLFAGRTTIRILVSKIDKVLLTKAPPCLNARGHRFGKRHGPSP